MKFETGFADLHPVIFMIYFFLMLCFTMFFMHPFCLAASMTGAVLYLFMLGGAKAVRKNFLMTMPIMIMAAVLNPLFNHSGETPILRLPWGSEITVQAVIYGFASALMLGSVICWFSCFNRIMTSDRLLCVLGRLTPSVSLLLSMVMRLVPRFSEQLKETGRAQKCIGRAASGRGAVSRAKYGLSLISVMLTWSLESSVETADSMRSRGYGLGKRGSFSPFRFETKDAAVTLLILLFGAGVVSLSFLGAFDFKYYPDFSALLSDTLPLGAFLYLAFALLPFVLQLTAKISEKINERQRGSV